MRCLPVGPSLGWLSVFSVVLGGCSIVAAPDDFTFVAPDAATALCTEPSDCAAQANAAVTCTNGTCVIDSCTGTFADCDGVLETGCEVNTASDLSHCGACGDTCDDTNASVLCSSGACTIAACDTGFEDCNSRASDGCETDLSQPETCGTCVRLCPSNFPICDATSDPAVCVESCGVPNEICGMTCTNVNADAQNCGGCGTVCPAVANAVPSCAAQTCGFDCRTGFGDCNTTESDGCEIDTTTDVDHCGGCNQACAGGNGIWSCVGSGCELAGCEGTFQDCDADGNSCEVDTSTDSNHCGGCGQVCDGPCVDGVCDPVVTAEMGFPSACAVRTSGDTYCWGYNTRGSVGDGTGLHRPRPTQVPGIGGTGELDAIAISTLGPGVTQAVTCAIQRDRKLACWGADTYGTSGDGASGNIEFSPVLVTSTDSTFATTEFQQVDVGYENVCAVDTLGGLWCWGRNAFGELGVAPASAGPPGIALRATAERVTVGEPVLQVAVGQNFVCAVRQSGDVYCWGQGTAGELADGVGASRHTPMPIATATDGTVLDDIIDIDAGSQFACVLRSGGNTYCWGVGAEGRLGQGTTANSNIPTPATVLGSGATDLTLGAHFTCVKTAAGGYECVGRGRDGQLGNGGTADAIATATAVSVLSADSQLFCGSLGCLGLDGGRLFAWGGDAFGQLGVDEDILRETPAPVVDASGGPADDIAAIRLGSLGGCSETISEGSRCFGVGTNGQLGSASTVTTSVPARTSGVELSGVTRAGNFGCGIEGATQDAFCWGTNPQGLGNSPSTNSSTIPLATNITTASVVSVGSDLTIGFGCAIGTAPGPIVCWGSNANSQLGRNTGTATEDTIPNPADQVVEAATSTPILDAVDVVAGVRHACAIRGTDRQVVCWGQGTSGQLGQGAAVSAPEAVRAGTLTNTIDLALGEFHTCAIAGATPSATEGSVFCWGFRNNGAVGLNLDGNQDTPFNVGIDDAVALGIGAAHTCALRASGAIQCWGLNDEAQLGDGTRTTRRTPVDSHTVVGAVGLSRGARDVKTTCAVTSGGGAQCWGRCVDGSCGTGEPFFEPLPLPVQGLGG